MSVVPLYVEYTKYTNPPIDVPSTEWILFRKVPILQIPGKRKVLRTPKSTEWPQTMPSLFRTTHKSVASAKFMCMDTWDLRSFLSPRTILGS